MDEDGNIIETADQPNKEDEANAGTENDNNETNDGERETDAAAGSNGAAKSTSGNAENNSTNNNAPAITKYNNVGQCTSSRTLQQGNSGTPGNTGSNETPQKSSVADIKNKYVPSFQALQSQANGKLQTHPSVVRKVSTATNKPMGKASTTDTFSISTPVRLKPVKHQTDSVFNGVLGAVKQDLAANGYNESYAQSFVDDYNAAKKARRDSLLSNALGR